MWVAIYCRSKDWVAVLKGLGSTVLDTWILRTKWLENEANQ
jgi:hypothetical protein